MEEYKDENFRFYWVDGILMCDWYIVHGTYEFVDKGIKKRLEISGDKPCCMISDVRSIKTSTREARQRLAGKDGANGIIAVGIVVNSQIQTAIANFFGAIYNPSTPYKLFTDKEKAKEWIKKFM